MIRWFARNGVAANLVAFLLVVGGVLSLPLLEVEMFPETSLDQISISTPYPGATPEEVEEGIVIRVEEAIQSVEGIKRIRSTAAEGAGIVLVEVESGYNVQTVKENLKTRVDSITTFPVDAERPIVEELLIPRDVLFLAVAGEADEKTLRRMAERVRDDLLAIPGISQVELLGVRDYEIAIEVAEETLRAYELTFDEVVAAVQASSVDVPGGAIKASGGEILLRTVGQAYVAEQFAEIVLRARPDGTLLKLGQMARIEDGFVDTDLIARFDRHPAAFLRVAEIGDESPLDISRKVAAYVESAREAFPEGVHVVKFADASFYLQDRLNLLVKNGLIGLVLVMIVLTAFLRPMLAFFVMLGIPISFLGTLLLAPVIGLSINLISLFAFILVLGIVVDDAIVVGESVFSEYQRSGPSVESAVRGTHAVTVPVVFAVLTTMVAFFPLFFLPGVFGKIFVPVPQVVIATLLWSLVQSKLVLPYHLTLIKTAGTRRTDAQLNFFQRFQRRIADGLEQFVERVYHPLLQAALRFRYVTLSAFLAAIVLTVGIMAGGWVRQVPFPVVPSDFIRVDLAYPAGTSAAEVERGVARLQAALQRVNERHADPGTGIEPARHLAVFSGGVSGEFGQFDTAGSADVHLATLLVELTKAEARTLSAIELTQEWRAAVGTIPGVKSLVFVAETETTAEKPISIQLQGRDFERMREAARAIKLRLADFPSVFDIGDNFSSGKREIELRVRPRAEPLGVTTSTLGRQVRSAFYGAEAQRVQRGRNDVRVMVRYPREARESVAALREMRIRLEDGSAVPFTEVAEVEIGQGFATIQREDRRRVLNVTANIDTGADVARLTPEVRSAVDAILVDYPDVTSALEGQTAENRETLKSMAIGLALVLVAIYALMAIPFKSYAQPIIVMLAVPFAFVGAIFGHLVTGQTLSMLSAMGVIAAVGVVVNDSLVMVHYVNRRRRDGLSVGEAAEEGGIRRFRPILLTSLTTFAGLVPILLERSLQAQFLIPMATSLAFGVLFATLVTLLLVPATYLILNDANGALRRLFRLPPRP